jgi:hypothetical protein
MFHQANSPFDNLQNEIAKEKFAALRRISEHLASCLRELHAMHEEIEEATRREMPFHEINRMIEAYNRLREDAEEWRYYFIVTREASGYFRGNLDASVYKIPPRKTLIRNP